MKTLLATAILAFAAVTLGACSSDNSSSPVTPGSGKQQGTTCTSSADCDTNLICAFSVGQAEAGIGPTSGPSSCGSAGTCVGIGPLSVVEACSCGSPSTVISVQQLGGIYTTTPAILCEPSQDASAGGSTTGG